MGQTVQARDGTNWVVRRLLLPAPLSASNLMGAAVESSGSQQHGSSLVGLLVRGVFVGVIGVVVLPFAVAFRLLFRRWTVEASAGETTVRWRAKSWGDAGAGVKAVAGAIERGESLQTPFAGLTPL
jgi:hypothetical protein